jgi:mannose-1-phosphate guanylyltransferase
MIQGAGAWLSDTHERRTKGIQGCFRLTPVGRNTAPAIATAARDLDFLRLDEKAFAACPADSVDYAVME